MAATLATIGYEGRTVEELLDALAAADISLLVDVRAVAASRRPGFSKTALAGALQERGIDYLHLRALGTPKAGREAARRGQIAEMHEIYEQQLETPEAQLALEHLRAIASEQPVALLCLEAEAAKCHRSIVADLLAGSGGFAVKDL